MNQNPFEEIAVQVAETHRLVAPMQADLNGSTEILKPMLSWKSKWIHEAMWILGSLPPKLTLRLVPEVVCFAGDERYSGDVRWLLGRLPFSEAEKYVVPAVLARLDSADTDYFDYLQSAGLFDYLGLYKAVPDLIAKALSSDDPDIREVGRGLESGAY